MINRRHGLVHISVSLILFLGLVGSAVAQDDSPDYWGLGTNFHFVGAEEFQSYDSDYAV